MRKKSLMLVSALALVVTGLFASVQAMESSAMAAECCCPQRTCAVCDACCEQSCCDTASCSEQGCCCD